MSLGIGSARPVARRLIQFEPILASIGTRKTPLPKNASATTQPDGRLQRYCAVRTSVVEVPQRKIRSMFDWLIVGAGFAGSVLAERLASQLGELVLLIDRRSHIGGNAHDRYDETGNLVPDYSRHVLCTNDIRTLKYLSQFTEWRRSVPTDEGIEDYSPFRGIPLRLPHGEVAAAEGVPFVQTTERASSVATGGSGALTIPCPEAWSRRIEALVGQPLVPAEGYTRMFEKMISHPNIKLMLNVDYSEIREIIPFRRLIYTGSIDEYFDYCYGKLPYKPIATDARAYPLAGGGGEQLFRRYEELAQASNGVFFIGRLADFKQRSMDQVIVQALTTFERISASTDLAPPSPAWTGRMPSSV